MASKVPDKTKPVVTKNSSEFQQDLYASHPTGELVLFVLAVLQAEASPVAVEEIVSTCFRLFPHSFSLKNYFYWPDSAVVTRHLQNAKDRGILKGSPADGYELKGKGKQSAKQTAKAFNVSLPVPPKVEVEKKEEIPVVKAEEKTAVPEEKKTLAKKSAVKKQAAKKEAAKPKSKPRPKKEKKAATPVKKKPAPKPKTEKKKAVKSAAKDKLAKPAAKKTVKTAVKAMPKINPVAKAKPAPKAKPESKKKVKAAPKAKAQKPKSSTPKQLPLDLAQPSAKKKAGAPAVKPKVKKEPLPAGDKKPVKSEVQIPAASKEEKVKAAKVIKQLERSDAYQLYRRNGKRAQIGEFDFRNMLFATMESSAETLKRNVELFKRYAGIHFRADLVAFLEFCEEKFSTLLLVKAKGKK